MGNTNHRLQTALQLEQLADQLRGETPSIQLEYEELDLNQAFERLRRVCPDGLVCLDIKLHWHSGSKIAASFEVYDGERHYGGRTLTAAVQAAEAFHAEPHPQPLEAVRRLLEPVTAAAAF
jgi:hypothetical protein